MFLCVFGWAVTGPSVDPTLSSYQKFNCLIIFHPFFHESLSFKLSVHSHFQLFILPTMSHLYIQLSVHFSGRLRLWRSVHHFIFLPLFQFSDYLRTYPSVFRFLSSFPVLLSVYRPNCLQSFFQISSFLRFSFSRSSVLFFVLLTAFSADRKSNWLPISWLRISLVNLLPVCAPVRLTNFSLLLRPSLYFCDDLFNFPIVDMLAIPL